MIAAEWTNYQIYPTPTAQDGYYSRYWHKIIT